jgi:hypothetical protein
MFRQKKKKKLGLSLPKRTFLFFSFPSFYLLFCRQFNFFFFFLKGKLTLLLPETTIQQTHRKCEHNQPPQVCTTIIYESKRLTQLQTVTNKQIQPTEWYICIDINIYLNKESVIHFGRQPMTKLMQAHSKLFEKTQNNPTTNGSTCFIYLFHKQFWCNYFVGKVN